METAESVKDILKEIVDSHEYKVNKINSLMGKACRLMVEQCTEQEEAITKLRDNFAKEKSLRKKDFDTIVGDILNQQRESMKSLIMLVDTSKSEAEKTVSLLRGFLGSFDGAGSIENFSQLRKQILDNQKESEHKVAEAMRKFDQDQEMLRTVLNKLFQKGETTTIRDLKLAMRSLNFAYTEDESELGKILKDLEDMRHEVTTRWQDVMSVTAGQRGV